MFVDYWCLRCGMKIASNLYKLNEVRWANGEWRNHWHARVEEAKKIHRC